MNNRLFERYGYLEPYGIPVVIGIPGIFILLSCLAYSIYSVPLKLFVVFGLLLGGIYWPALLYLTFQIKRSATKTWSKWQIFVWWQMLLTSPLAALMVGMFYFGIFYPIWAIGVWAYEKSTPSILLAVIIGVVTLLFGSVLFWIRLRYRAVYGVTEIGVGVLVASHRSYSFSAPTFVPETDFLLFLLTAGVYLVVRGFDNIYIGFFKEPRDRLVSVLMVWWDGLNNGAVVSLNDGSDKV